MCPPVPVIPTSSCRDARSVRPSPSKPRCCNLLYKERPPARHFRASLQDEVTASDVTVVRQRTHRACVPTGLVSVRPLYQRLQRRDFNWDGRTHRSAPTRRSNSSQQLTDTTDALPLDTPSASLHFAARIGTSTNRFVSRFAKILWVLSYQQLSVYV